MDKTVVIETQQLGKAEWEISFGGYNPSPEDYFKMENKEAAFRLQERLEEYNNG